MFAISISSKISSDAVKTELELDLLAYTVFTELLQTHHHDHRDGPVLKGDCWQAIKTVSNLTNIETNKPVKARYAM